MEADTIRDVTVYSNLSPSATLGRAPATEIPFAAPSAELTKAIDQPSASRSPIVYCLVLLLLPLLAIPGFIALGRSNFFLQHGASVWVRSNDNIFNMRGRTCDVLVFGDSTAMTGLNPAVLDRDTGLRTCNIAVTNAVLAVTDNMALDHYLAQNAAPRVILFQLSPDDFQRRAQAWDRTIYAEGLLELLRHGSPAQVRHTLLHHPRESIAFAGYVAGYTSFYAFRSLWSHLSGHPLEEDRIVIRNGFFTPPAAARTFCTPAGERADPSRRSVPESLVSSLREVYTHRAGAVLVNVAPIPACDENLAAFRSQLAGLTSNSLTALPVTLFNDDRHYTAAGAGVVSHLAAEELREVAERDPALLSDPLPGQFIRTASVSAPTRP